MKYSANCKVAGSNLILEQVSCFFNLSYAYFFWKYVYKDYFGDMGERGGRGGGLGHRCIITDPVAE